MQKALLLKEQTGFKGHTDSFDEKLLLNKPNGPLILYKKIVLFSSETVVYMDTMIRINPADMELKEWATVTELILSTAAIIKKLLRDFFRIST